jgi:transmembrane sensor
VVAVLEGQVRVHPTTSLERIAWLPLTSARDNAEPIGAGHQAIVDSTGARSTTRLADPASLLGWQHGQIAFDNEPLRDVIEDVNRYASTPVVLADERLGDIRITGTVSGSDIEGWIASLRPALGIQAENREGQIVLHRP